MKAPSPPPARSRSVAPESFVVRIYRRDARAPTRVTGTVEMVDAGTEMSFRNLRELQRILAGRPDHKP